MSRFFSKKYDSLVPYTPGEQPKDRVFIKLNTNESPFPPSSKALAYAREAAENLQLYSDPECRALVQTAAKRLGVNEDEILFTNGSDGIVGHIVSNNRGLSGYNALALNTNQGVSGAKVNSYISCKHI